MLVRLTAPVALLIGLLLAHQWSGDFTTSAHRLRNRMDIPLKENSFRCLFDNKLWEADSLTAEVIRYERHTTIYLYSSTNSDRLAFQFSGNLIPGCYVLDNPSAGYVYVTHPHAACLFSTDEYYQGMLMIDYLDETTNQLTGSFELLAYSDECRRVIRIHNGQFNVKYRVRGIS